MKSLPILLTILALSASVFAGCIGGDDVAPEEDTVPDRAEEATVTATTGSVRGTVSTDLFEPLGGAQVAIIETAQETKVAKGGDFTFNDVEPGFYTLFVVALGYESATRGIDVKAGEITQITLQLTPLVADDPWIDFRDYVGLVTYAVAWQAELPTIGCYIGPEPPAGITPKSCGGLRGGGSVNGEVHLNVTDDVKTVMVEMIWDPAGPLGEYLSLDFMCPLVPRASDGGSVLDTDHVCFFDTPGTKSPLVHRVDESHWIENDYNFTGDWAARVFATYGMAGTHALTGVDVGVAYEQTFKLFTSVFHKERAGEAYTGIPDQ